MAFGADPVRDLYTLAKARAKRRGLVWELSYNVYLRLAHDTKVCPVFGIPLLYDTYTGNGRGKANPTKASLDRIDSEVGYTNDNVWIISWAANRMKSDLSMEDFKELLRRGQKFAWSTMMETDAEVNLKQSSTSTGEDLPQTSNSSPSTPTTESLAKSENSSMTSLWRGLTYSSKSMVELVALEYPDTTPLLDLSEMQSK